MHGSSQAVCVVAQAALQFAVFSAQSDLQSASTELHGPRQLLPVAVQVSLQPLRPLAQPLLQLLPAVLHPFEHEDCAELHAPRQLLPALEQEPLQPFRALEQPFLQLLRVPLQASLQGLTIAA